MKFSLATKIINKLFSATHIINSKIFTSQNQSYPSFKITLPSDHLLPRHQKKYKNYDRFLPHAVKYLNTNDLVIDVGANCGDTLAAMVSTNPRLQYVGIEPDSTFYEYLEKNILIMRKKCNANIHPIKALVGQEISNAVLIGTGGTKNATTKEQILNIGEMHTSRSLDEIFEHDLKSSSTYLKLIKSDVDGFDYDVINSAKIMIKNHKPILFFECQCDTENQKASYIATIERLIESGYKNYWLFDNFGELLLQTKDIENIKMLIEYVWRQKKYSTQSTIFYFDILCCNEEKSALVTKITNDYITSILSTH